MPVDTRCARSPRRAPRCPRRRTGTARRARRSRRRARSWCRSRPRSRRAGTAVPGQISRHSSEQRPGERPAGPRSPARACAWCVVSTARPCARPGRGRPAGRSWRGRCTARARTRSQPACSSKSTALGVAGRQLARGRAAARRRASRRPSGSPSRVSLERSEGRLVLRVGHLLAANSAKAANSRRRPSRVATAISSSMWSEKNWNGARSPCSSPWKSIGVNGARSVHERGERARLDGQPVAERAVADLVVVGGEDDERARARSSSAGAPKRRRAERRVGAVVEVRPVQRLRQLRRASPNSA